MRDRWVAVYLLVVVLQLPIFIQLGEGPLRFGFAIKEAEERVEFFDGAEGDGQVVTRALDRARSLLEDMDDKTSRSGRVMVNEAIFLWKSGRADEAEVSLKSAHQVFVEHQGPDSFHAVAVELRLAELNFLRYRFNEALKFYGDNVTRMEEFLGPRNSYVVRQKFRLVCTLVALGQRERASDLARSNLKFLELVAVKQDRSFLSSTGRALDLLRKRGHFEGPLDQETWEAYLESKGGLSALDSSVTSP